MARDILKTNSQYLREVNEYVAEDIARFVSTLSSRLQESIDDSISSSDIFNAHKNQ
ncbi:TPA: hypothetical protein ACPI0X_001085 [Haemophilus influenzae]|jgi:hypothetical protein|nr:hypothetical protein [Haemophilus influenzae]